MRSTPGVVRPPRGYVVVAIRRAGGPADGGQPVGGVVSIFNSRGGPVTLLDIKEGRTVKVGLSPGHYSLGLGKQRPTQSRLGGCKPKVATVKAGWTTHYSLWYGCFFD